MSDNFLKSFGKVGLANLLSRFFGFLREVVKAGLLGTTAAGDAFQIAFVLPNALRSISAEGSMLAVFLPIFSEAQSKDGKHVAKRFFVSLFWIMLITLSLLSVIFIISADFLIANVLAKGLEGQTLDQTIFLARIMFGYIILISAAALMQGVLNYHGQFFIPIATQMLLSLMIIIFGLLAFYQELKIATSMAIGVIVGGILQLGIPMIMVAKKGYFRSSGKKDSKLIMAEKKSSSNYLLSTLKNFFPSAFGSGINHINLIINNAIATSLVSGSVVALNLSSRLLDTVVSLFVTSQTIVLLPMISKSLNQNKIDDANKLLNQSLGLASFLTLPIMFLFFGNADLIIEVLFVRGAFNQDSAKLTLEALIFYLPCIIFMSANRIMHACYVAQKMFKMIVRFAIVTMIANALLAYFLAKKMQISGISAALTISQILLFCLMSVFMSRKTKNKIDWWLIAKKSFIKHLTAAAVMFLGVYGYSQFQLFGGLLEILAICSLGGVIYLTVNYLLKSTEIKYILTILYGKKNKPLDAGS